MLLFSDNDILIKLGLLNLLPDFLRLLKLTNEQVFIADTTPYSLPEQLKKYTKDPNIYQPLLNLVNSFQKVQIDNIELLKKLNQIDNIDSGEAILAIKVIEDKNAFLATGDKRFLRAIQDTEFSNDFNKRVYTFELSLLMLSEFLGYEVLKSRILMNSALLDKSVDGMLKLAFKEKSTKSHDIECLHSFTKDIQELRFLILLI